MNQIKLVLPNCSFIINESLEYVTEGLTRAIVNSTLLSVTRPNETAKWYINPYQILYVECKEVE